MSRRRVMTVVVVLAFPAVLLLVLVNGGVLQHLASYDPGVFAMSYRSARWRPPLGVSVEGLELRIQTDGFHVRIRAEAAGGTFVPSKLLRKRVAFDDVTARGVSVEVRLPDDSNGTPGERLPPIDDFAPARPTPEPVLAVELTRLREVQVREVWIDGFRYSGDIVASGGFALQPKERLWVFPAELSIDGGVVALPNGLEARFAPSHVTGELDAMPIDVPPKQEMFRALTAEVRLAFHTPNLNSFNAILFDEIPDVRLLGGAGDIELDLHVDAGVLEEGSAVRIAPRELGVRVPHFDIVGQASIDVTAKEGKAVAEVSLPRFELRTRAPDARVATGQRARLIAAVAPLDLTQVRNVDVHLELQEARSDDLSFLDRFIPAGSGITLVGGAGRAEVEATLSTRTQRARGKLSLTASDIELRNRGAVVKGAAELTAILNAFDLKRRNFDLAGTGVKLNGVTVKTREVSYKNVSLSAVAPRAFFSPETQHPVQATVAVGVSNLQPLMGIVSANVPLPGLVVALLNIPDVAGSAELDVDHDRVRLSPVALTAKGLRVDAQVTLHELADHTMEPHGVALARLGILSVGLGFDGGVVTPVLFGASQWYVGQTDAGVP